MTIKEQIKTDMIIAMKAKESNKVTVLRGVLAAFTNELVAKKMTPQEILPEEDSLAVITRLAKQRKDAIQQFTDGGREDLAADEKAELAILETYLPKLMSEEEVKKVVKAKIAELGITDKTGMGQLMGSVMSELKGKADGGVVKKLVDEALS